MILKLAKKLIPASFEEKLGPKCRLGMLSHVVILAIISLLCLEGELIFYGIFLSCFIDEC